MSKFHIFITFIWFKMFAMFLVLLIYIFTRFHSHNCYQAELTSPKFIFIHNLYCFIDDHTSKVILWRSVFKIKLIIIIVITSSSYLMVLDRALVRASLRTSMWARSSWTVDRCLATSNCSLSFAASMSLSVKYNMSLYVNITCLYL